MVAEDVCYKVCQIDLIKGFLVLPEIDSVRENYFVEDENETEAGN